MKKAKVIEKFIFFTTEISLLIFFTSENSTFKYALYFINIFLYFINLCIIKKTFRLSLLFDFYKEISIFNGKHIRNQN